MKAKIWQILVLLLMLVSLVGCAANTMDKMEIQSNGAVRDDYMMAETSVAMPESGGMGNPQTETGRKWIVTIHMQAETEDLNAMLINLDQRVQELGGYVQSSSVYNGSAYSGYRRYRSADLTIRIPAEKADQFAEQVAQNANVVSNNKTMEDITLTYVSVESRMKALQVEEERLLVLLSQAQNMTELLEIESRLTDVRYELERVTSQLRVYDNQVDYATIYLNISEVMEYTVVEEQTVWQRIASGFVSNLKSVGNMFVELFVFVLANLPVLLVWAAVIWVAVFLIRRSLRKRHGKRSFFRRGRDPHAEEEKPEE